MTSNTILHRVSRHPTFRNHLPAIIALSSGLLVLWALEKLTRSALPTFQIAIYLVGLPYHLMLDFIAGFMTRTIDPLEIGGFPVVIAALVYIYVRTYLWLAKSARREHDCLDWARNDLERGDVVNKKWA